MTIAKKHEAEVVSLEKILNSRGYVY